MKTYNKVIAAVVAGIVCSAVTSQAALTTLTPGNIGGAAATGYTEAGTQLTTTGPIAYTFGATSEDTGFVTTTVYNNDANNTVGGLSGLVFLYTVQITGGDITGMSLNGAWLGTIGIASVTGSFQNIGNYNYKANGASINLGWAGGSVGTLQFVIDTSATAWEGSIASLQDSAPDGSVNILSPVPEPATIAAGALMLLPLGIGAVRSLRKERTA